MLYVLTGKSSSGKDTLQNGLLALNDCTADEKYADEKYQVLVSTTSRPMREGEQEGREYYFTSNEGFKKKISEGYFLEYREYHTLVENKPATWYYGLGKSVPNKEIAKPGSKYITILDLYGANECIKYYGKENCKVIYLSAPDDIREERAKKRGSFDKTEWDRRLKDDDIKFSEDKLKEIVNIRFANIYDKETLISCMDEMFTNFSHNCQN